MCVSLVNDSDNVVKTEQLFIHLDDDGISAVGGKIPPLLTSAHDKESPIDCC